MPADTTRPLLDHDIEQRLQRLAEARGRSRDGLVREAVSQYVERAELGDQFDRDSLAAWTELQTNGLHITADEADAWLARLEAGEITDPPGPHK